MDKAATSEIVNDYLKQVSSLLPYPFEQKKDIIAELRLDLEETLNEGGSNNPVLAFGSPRDVARDLSLSKGWESMRVGFKLRAISYFVDWVLGLLLGVMVAIALMSLLELIDPLFFQTIRPTPQALMIFLSFTGLPLLVKAVYPIILEGRYSTTIGKWLLGLWVVDSSGVKITWHQAFLRSLSKGFLPFLMIDVLAGLFQKSDDQRALDAATGTCVIYCKKDVRTGRWSSTVGLILVIISAILIAVVFLPYLLFGRWQDGQLILLSNSVFFIVYGIVSIGFLPAIIGIALLRKHIIRYYTSRQTRETAIKAMKTVEEGLTDYRSKKSSTYPVEAYLGQVDKLLPYPRKLKAEALAELRMDLIEAMQDSGESDPVLAFGIPRTVARDVILSHDWETDRAGYGLRGLAYVIDTVIGFFTGIICYMLLLSTVQSLDPTFLQGSGSPLPANKTLVFLVILSVPLIVNEMYLIFIEGIFSTTAGKRLLSLVVVDSSGMKISAHQAVVRNLTKFLPLFLLIDVLIGLLQKNAEQRASEIVAETRVVKIRR